MTTHVNAISHLHLVMFILSLSLDIKLIVVMLYDNLSLHGLPKLLIFIYL